MNGRGLPAARPAGEAQLLPAEPGLRFGAPGQQTAERDSQAALHVGGGLCFPFAEFMPFTAVLGSLPTYFPGSYADVLQKEGVASKLNSLQGTTNGPHLLVYIKQCGATILGLSSLNAVLLP